MSEPRLHHYVPRFFLNGFATLERPKSAKKRVIWVYERGKQIRRSTPDKEARRRDFYAFREEGVLVHDVENALASVECIAAPLLGRFASPSFFPDKKERAVVSLFAALMFTRVPSHREFVDKEFSRFVKTWLQEGAKNEARFNTEFARFQEETGRPEISAEEAREVILDGDYDVERASEASNLNEMMALSEQIAAVVFGHGWQIWHAQKGEFFLTSDNPVVTSLRGPGWIKFGVGFGLPHVEVVFPLSATSCLFIKPGVREGVFPVGNRSVRDVNKRLIMCAHRHLYSGESSRKISDLFDRIGGQVIYGENAFLTPDSSKIRICP